MGFIDFIRTHRDKRALAHARDQAWVFHHRNMRESRGSWMGFFAPTNGMEIFTFHTANLGFSRVIEALESVAGKLAEKETIFTAGLEITCTSRSEYGAFLILTIKDKIGNVAQVIIKKPTEDWRTGQLKASHQVSMADVFKLDITEYREKGCYRAGATSNEDYAAYVSFFDIFRPLVIEVSPIGNLCDSAFNKACHHLVGADGGLPGPICLRDYGLMCADRTAQYLYNKIDDISNVHTGLSENGFIFGQRKLVHGTTEMFALERSSDGKDSFVLSDPYNGGQPCVFTFEKIGRKVSTIEMRQGPLDVTGGCVPEISYSVKEQSCRLANSTVVDHTLENALRLLDSAKEVLCGRKIDYAAYAAFKISEDFGQLGHFEQQDDEKLKRPADLRPTGV